MLRGQGTQQLIHTFQAVVVLIGVRHCRGPGGSLFDIKPQDAAELIQLRFKVVEQLNGIAIL